MLLLQEEPGEWEAIDRPPHYPQWAEAQRATHVELIMEATKSSAGPHQLVPFMRLLGDPRNCEKASPVDPHQDCPSEGNPRYDIIPYPFGGIGLHSPLLDMCLYYRTRNTFPIRSTKWCLAAGTED